MPLGEDEFILQRMFQAREFGDPDLVAMRFQIKTAQDVCHMRAEFPPLDGMAPELIHRPMCVFQFTRQLRLTAGHQSDIFRIMFEREKNSLVGGGVAGMQRRDDIDRAQ